MARRKTAAVVTEEAGASAPVETAPQVAKETVVTEEAGDPVETAPQEVAVTEEVEVAAEADVFPKVMTIKNNTPSAHAFPVVGVVIAPYGEEQATFKSADQLKRFLTDAEAICELNKWVDGIVVS